MNSMVTLVVELITNALDKTVRDVVVLHSNEEVDLFIKEGEPSEVFWISGEVEEPIYQFWRLRKEKLLTEEAHIIFTGAEDTPRWNDLDCYKGAKFGSIYLLVYDRVTNPKPLPSQKGMFL